MIAGWAAVAVAGAGLLGWSIYLDLRLDSHRRLAARWVSRARAWRRWAGPCSLLVSAAVLACYGLLALLGRVLATELGNPRWALLVVAPAMLAYAPFVFATAPVDPSGYSSWRSDLASAGADRREQRRIAWCAGPPSLVGMFAMIATLVWIFVP